MERPGLTLGALAPVPALYEALLTCSKVSCHADIGGYWFPTAAEAAATELESSVCVAHVPLLFGSRKWANEE